MSYPCPVCGTTQGRRIWELFWGEGLCAECWHWAQGILWSWMGIDWRAAET